MTTRVVPYQACRLEVFVGAAWVNLTGETRSIAIVRKDSAAGTLSAEILDATLDPVTASTLRPGHPIRVRVIDPDAASGYVDVFVGKLDGCSVARNPLAPKGKGVNIKVTGTDLVAELANIPEPHGVATINELRFLAAAYSFIINGSSTPLGSADIVSANENAKLWDQILITRDSNLGYAWVDKSNRLRVYDTTGMDTTVAATFRPANYSDLNIDFDLDQIMNSVTISWLRYNVTSDEAVPIVYGPYRDEPSIDEWGEQRADFTMHGPEENRVTIEDDLALAILARNATAEVRPKSASVPMRKNRDLDFVRDIDLDSYVDVVYHDGHTTKQMRVIGITHTIDNRGWIVDFEFALPEALPAPGQPPETPSSYLPVVVDADGDPVFTTSPDGTSITGQLKTSKGSGSIEIYDSGGNGIINFAGSATVAWIGGAYLQLTAGGAAIQILPGAGSSYPGMAHIQVVNGMRLGSAAVPIPTGGSANVHRDGNGYIYTTTSTRRHKADIVDLELDLDAAYDVPARQFRRVVGLDLGTEAGFIAEELHDRGLTMFVEYDVEGDPIGVKYPTWVVVLHRMAQVERAARLELEGRVNEQDVLIAELQATVAQLVAATTSSEGD